MPPTRTRFWFWAIGRRVDPLYRPWAAEQITRPDYVRKRLWPLFAVQTVLIAVPQTLLALAAHSRLRLIPPAALLGFYAVYAVVLAVRRKPMSDGARRRLLAYHGVTAEGTLVTPVSAWAESPLRKTELALFAVLILVFSSGVAVAADRLIARRACHVLPAADMAALSAFVGQPVPSAASAFGAPVPIVAPGTRLVAAREVDTFLPGMRYIAAYVPGLSGHLIGPAVWRLIEPHSVLNPSANITVDAQDFLARQITPNTGYGSNQPPDPTFDQAKDCAKAAR